MVACDRHLYQYNRRCQSCEDEKIDKILKGVEKILEIFATSSKVDEVNFTKPSDEEIHTAYKKSLMGVCDCGYVHIDEYEFAELLFSKENK